MVEGYGDIARISNDVDGPAIVRLKAFVALQQTRSRKPPHSVIGVEVDFGDPGFDVGESDRIALIDQVSNQKASPGVPRTRIRHQEHIIRKNSEATAGHLAAEKDPPG